MSETLTINLANRQQAWEAIKSQAFPFLAGALQASRRFVMTIKPETRTESQNRLMWPILSEFSKQLDWPINGHMTKMDADDWKDVLTCAWKRETVRLAMGMDGGVVMLGQRTSRFTKAEFAEFIEFLYASAADRGVKLPAWQGDAE